MSLRTVFLLCFAIACLPAVGWSAWIAVRAQAEWINASSAVRMAEAMGDALQLVEALSLERGVLQERALSDDPITGNMADIAARNDALLDRAQRSMQLAGLPDEAVRQSRASLVSVRRDVAEGIARPLAQRDPRLAPAIMARLYERLGAVQGAVARAEREAAKADARVGSLVEVGSLAVDIRAAAGWRSSNLSTWFGGRALTPHELEEAMYMTGAVQYAWDRLQRQVLVVGEPPLLAAAVSATRDGFFRLAEPRYREALAIAQAGGPRPTTLSAWRKWTVAALGGTLLARDAAIAEAVEYGTAVAVQAQIHLAVAAASALGMFALGAGALLVLLRRLVLPMQRLTRAVTLLAGGDVAASVPECGRRDEIGAMAAAIEIFRANAVQLRHTNLRFEAALSNMSQGLAMYDAEERLVVFNARLCELVCLPPGTLRLGMTYHEILRLTGAAGHFPGRNVQHIYNERRRIMSGRADSVCFEEERGGRTLSILSRPLSDGGWLLTIEDVTERRHNESQIAHMAHHDALTGMANRALFQTRLKEAIARFRRGECFSVLYLDLDRFKEVNDTLGHGAGDALLQAVSARLWLEVRDTDTVARLGGDEFAILQAAGDQPCRPSALADRLIAAVGLPYDIAGHQVVIGLSIGIAEATANDEDTDTLLRNADLALYRAKAEGRGTWRLFEPQASSLPRHPALP